MATNYSDRISTKPLIASSSVYSITDLDRLPLNRHRQSASLKSLLLAAATLLVVLLTAIVVYLVVSLCLVQQQLTTVSRELTSASNRLDRVEKELRGAQKDYRTLPEEFKRSENRTATNLPTMLQRMNTERHNNRKRHRIGKREATSGSPTSAVKKPKKDRRDSRDRQMRLVWKYVKDFRSEIESVRNEVAHPSALMVLPSGRQNSYEDFASKDDNALQWVVENNNLFDMQDFTQPVTQLVVKTAGTYFIYLQITYNGQSKSVNPTCSHMVMLRNSIHPDRYKPLLHGSTTQYKLGRVIRFPLHGDEVRAIDTVHQSGVFQLTVGDRIYVKPDDFSHDCIVSPIKDKTFFGVFRLQSNFIEYD